jgi:tRNA A37 threonylcarbamoyladenosine synthetase subunit TsaC/SUA5/YrdC
MRIPDFPWLRDFIRKVGAPILAPSANFSGKQAPASFKQIDKELLGLVDYAIDLAELKVDIRQYNKPSTIVDLSGYISRIVRVGAGDSKYIRRLLEEPGQ